MIKELYICRNYLSLFIINQNCQSKKIILFKQYFEAKFLIDYLKELKKKKKIFQYYILKANNYDLLYNNIKFYSRQMMAILRN